MSGVASVLIANRGEIAVRIAVTLRRMGIRVIAVYSDADAGEPHTRAADVAVRLGPRAAAESYLNVEALLAAAQRTEAEAIHPGYGFLAESADFARAVEQAGLCWIGPPAQAIAAMGDKITAKRLAAEAGVPVVPGVHKPGMNDDTLMAAAAEVGTPLLVKAAAGGGGKGMRRVDRLEDLPEALRAARTEAAASFDSGELLLERLIEEPRHIEVQVLADAHGGVIHLGERECTLQRRHQKVIEEAPSPVVGAPLRAEMGEAAVALAQQVGYVGVGTVEFVAPADEPDRYSFLEMNTRLQVEHPVTETVTGIDLVECQVRVAAGEPLGVEQAAVALSGHAIEARVYAEDPARGFLPTGGPVLAADQTAADCRVDTGVAVGAQVVSDYDPMLAKVIAAGSDRGEARRRLDAGLADYHLLGVATNVAFLRALLSHPEVAAARMDTALIERDRDRLLEVAGLPPQTSPPEEVLVAAALARRLAREPASRPGAAVDPFAVPDGWRLGEPAWTPVEFAWDGRADSTAQATVEVSGTLSALEVRVDGGEPRPVDIALEARGEAGRVDGPSAPAFAGVDELSGWLAVTLDGFTRKLLVAEAGEVIWAGRDGRVWALRERSPLAAARTAAPAAQGPLVAPLPGTVAEVSVAEDEAVRAEQTLVVVEAMKMHHPITAPADGRVAKLHVAAGDRVVIEQPLVEVTADDAGEQDEQEKP